MRSIPQRRSFSFPVTSFFPNQLDALSSNDLRLFWDWLDLMWRATGTFD
ncbi:MAG: hypothetical protein ABSG56_03415 [Bryobacteraceae bacterium]